MGKRKNIIGTKNESSLHRFLKLSYAGSGGKTEVVAGDFIADGLSKGGEYIEVQTGSFAPLKQKVKEFTAAGKVRIIYPIAVKKTIELYECPPGKGKKAGVLISRTKSPKKGSLWDIFDALIYAPELPLTRGVMIEAVMADITEKRVKDGKGSWRRKWISIKDRELDTWHESFLFKKPADYLCFIPFKKNEEFTSRLLAETMGIKTRAAGKALYVLTKMGLVERIGKEGRLLLYKKSQKKQKKA